MCTITTEDERVCLEENGVEREESEEEDVVLDKDELATENGLEYQ